jgi:hypothetical protein
MVKKKRTESAAPPGAPEVPEQVEPASATFPFAGEINKYGFLHFGKDVMAALGLTKGVAHKIIIESADLDAQTVTVKIPDSRKKE